MHTFKVIGLLLHYPDAELVAHTRELGEALDAEGLVTGRCREGFERLLERLRSSDLLDLQAEYVETFDRGRARSLHLFEHVHGESRDRGQAMVDLLRVYRENGFELASPELPDYLPLFLEFLSTLELEQAASWLEETGPLLAVLHARLAEDGNPYAVLFEPLLALAGCEPEDAELRARVAAQPPDNTAQALDRVWMEEPVTFGPEGGCPSARPQRKTTPIQWAERRQQAR